MQAKSIPTTPHPTKLAGLRWLFFVRPQYTGVGKRGRSRSSTLAHRSRVRLNTHTYGPQAWIRFYASLAIVYSLTLVFAWYIFSPATFFIQPIPPAIQAAPALLLPPTPPPPNILSGKPVRIIVPRLGINLLVEEGNYDSIKHTWTLSAGNAHFAAPSMPPNNYRGNTLIYGHNHDLVLGRLRNGVVGDEAKILTENGHTFFYSFVSAENVKPDNMGVFQYQGPPTLVIQTCTGNWNETRGLYSFKLVRVE